MVKFQRLQRAFPHRPRDFNLLYLGSSSLPDGRADGDRARAAPRRAGRRQPERHRVPGVGGRRHRAAQRAAARRARAPRPTSSTRAQFCKEAADEFLGPPAGIVGDPPERRRHARSSRPAEACRTASPVLLLAGDQSQAYRLETALETLALLPDARLLVTGSSVVGGRAAHRASSASPTASTSSAATRSATRLPLYRRAHVLLHPKVRDPCPNVVLEALACGVPVVHSASGGVPELVGRRRHRRRVGDDVGASTCRPRRPSWPRRCGRCSRRSTAIAARARARAVERFDLAPWIERHRALFSELVG